VRVLALDYGSARCGCALSDPTGTIVTPLEAVERPATKRGFARLRELVRSREVEIVIVGLPVALDGSDTAQTRETRALAQQLSERLGREVAVEMHDERFTTRIAQRMAQPERARARTNTARRSAGASVLAGEDSRAAAHLLESWLASQAR
jgi:putative holliday junction resolvase